MQFRGHLYRPVQGIKFRRTAARYVVRRNAARYAATQEAVIDDQYWRGEQLTFWILAVVDSKTGSDLPAPAKQLNKKTWAKLPKVIRDGVGQDADVKQAILDCTDRGTCQYIELQGGWYPGEKKGAQQVEQVQATLEWIQQFRQRPTVSGSKLIWAEVNSQVQKQSK